MQSKYIFIFLALASISKLYSQTQESSLEKAKRYYTEKQFKKAEYILQQQIKKDPDDLYACWLYAQIAHEKGHKNLSKVLYQRAIVLDPENGSIQMDYARSLFYSQQLKEAEKELNRLIHPQYNDNIRAEAHLLLAYINYWFQNKQKTEHHIKEILALNPKDHAALELKEGIKKFANPFIKINLDYSKDDQPLKDFSETVEVGINKSNLFNPRIQMTNHNFNTNENTFSFNIGNAFTFHKIGFSAFISAGLYKNFSENLEFTGEAKLKQKIIKGLDITAGINQLPYLNTAISTHKSIKENNIYGRIEYQNSNILDINMLYQHKFFNDNNYINTFGGWVISSPVKLNIFEFKAGYGYSYSDSKKIVYSPEKPLEDYLVWAEVPGFYNPYFSPKRQETHSVIGIIKASLSSKFSINVTGSYGWYARNYSPLLYKTQNAGQDETTILFFKSEYHPFNIKADINYNISERCILGAYYEHQKTAFYNLDKAGTVFIYRF